MLFLAGFRMPARHGDIRTGITGRSVVGHLSAAAPGANGIVDHGANVRSFRFAGLPTVTPGGASVAMGRQRIAPRHL